MDGKYKEIAEVGQPCTERGMGASDAGGLSCLLMPGTPCPSLWRAGYAPHRRLCSALGLDGMGMAGLSPGAAHVGGWR